MLAQFTRGAVLWSQNFLLDTEPVKKLRLWAVAVWLSGTVVAKYSSHNFIKFSHILTIYTQIERKNRYTFKKLNYLL